MLMNMRDLLAVAHANKFAVPAFNVSSNMLLKGAIEASEEKRAPVIVAIHPDELSFIRLYCNGLVGDNQKNLHYSV